MKNPLRNLLTALLLAPLAELQAADVPQPKPNIIIHFIDDLGYGDIGPFGAVKQKTPHLDRMAQEGRPVQKLRSVEIWLRFGQRFRRVSQRFTMSAVSGTSS